MKYIMPVNLNSEIGKLNGVIIHSPGAEVASMSPSEVEHALFSDIINTDVANREYFRISSILSMFSQTFQVRDLLSDVLADEKNRLEVLNRVQVTEPQIGERLFGTTLKDKLMQCSPFELSRLLVEGVELERDNVRRFLSRDRYSLIPLYNMFFTRDSAFCIGNKVISSKMANIVRNRESVIMKSIFDFIPEFKTSVIDLDKGNNLPIGRNVTIEGGDVLVLRDDILVIGCGARTTAEAIDSLIENISILYKERELHVLVQELPLSPASFIHLDMVFTMLDRNECMVYAPVIYSHGIYRAVHVCVRNGKISLIEEKDNLLSALKELGMDLKPVFCGADKPVSREREQWHSGANFFALAPGKVMGYARNYNTVEVMNNAGYDIFRAIDIIEGKANICNSKKFFITIDVSELTRGGGGLRCMTMPFNREIL